MAKRLQADVSRYLQTHVASGTADNAQRWLKESCERVHHAVLITASATLTRSGQPDRVVWAALRRLSRQGIYVLVATDRTRHSLARLAGSKVRVVVAPSSIALCGEIERLGLRYNHILTVIGADPSRGVELLVSQGLSVHLNDKSAAAGEAPPDLGLPFWVGREIGGDLAYGRASRAHEERPLCIPLVMDGRRKAGRAAMRLLLSTMVFAPRINVTPQSDILHRGQLPPQFAEAARKAASTLSRGLRALPQKVRAGCTTALDARSGAVFFRATEWRSECQQAARLLPRTVAYFQAQLPDYWTPDRPCMRRVLYTPTKVLLRGEQYYVNMRNESPLLRIESMWTELDAWQGLASEVIRCRPKHGSGGWKFVLAYLDQSRSIALQTFLFVHSAPERLGLGRLASLDALLGSARSGVHGFLRAVIDAYYCWLLGDQRRMRGALIKAVALWVGLRRALLSLLQKCSMAAAKPAHRDSLAGLVRRWREADHPGENLLTAATALRDGGARPARNAVGIGWGGIELAFVYDFVFRQYFRHGVRVQIAQWSHYRGRKKPVVWYRFPRHSDRQIRYRGAQAVLFDDNVLTGITLEHIRDELLLRGAQGIKVFVTRYSGERRFAHMRMPDHGIVDPEFLLNGIGGYLGETPFARSWSEIPEKYTSPIGVFSLSRRRILECIHNNSTVELYDREGF